MNQIDVQIMGQSYVLGCPEGGEQPLREAVARVDSAMCKIRDAGKVRSRERIAVLAALNLAFDLVQAPTQVEASADRSDAVPTEAAADAANPFDQAVAAQLIERLDQALAGDGLLL